MSAKKPETVCPPALDADLLARLDGVLENFQKLDLQKTKEQKDHHQVKRIREEDVAPLRKGNRYTDRPKGHRQKNQIIFAKQRGFPFSHLL